MSWQPTATIDTLRHRAVIISKIRDFFEKRQVLEVETPLLCSGTVPSPYIESFKLGNQYLQTSPEFPMKRLLAAGSGSIYQLCKAFRLEESGRLHNPEFTILEWYRVGFDHHDLMKEAAELLQVILQCNVCDFVSYQALFENAFHFNPHTVSVAELKACAAQRGLNIDLVSKDDWLSVLLTHFIEPTLAFERPCFVYDFPESQAALAKLRRQGDIWVGERFEVYYKGIELANGFHELGNSQEQRERFEAELAARRANKQALPSLDEWFIESLDQLPNCAGVALGVDRLIMLALPKASVKEVMSFDAGNA